MSVVDDKKKIFGEIAALRVAKEGIPKFKLDDSFLSVNNSGDSMEFLTDLLKTLVGFEALKDVIIETIAYNLDSIELGVKETLKKVLNKSISCGINPSIPDWVKHQNINPVSTGFDVNIKKLDYLGIMLTNPTSRAGKLFYDDADSGVYSSDFNTFLFNTMQNINSQQNWGSVTTNNDILSLTFNPTGAPNNTINVKVSEYYSNPSNNKKMMDLNNDFIDSIDLFDASKLINGIVDSIFGTISLETKKSDSQLMKDLEIEKIIDNIVKADDTKVIDDSYFKFSNDNLVEFESSIENKKKGVNNLNLDNNLDSSIPFDELSGINDLLKSSISNSDLAQNLNSSLDKLGELSALGSKLGDIKSIKLNFIDTIIKKLISAIMSIVLSPKLIMIFALNHSIIYGTTFKDPIDFMLKNKTLINSVIQSLKNLVIQLLLAEVLKRVSELIASSYVETRKEKYKLKLAQKASLLNIPEGVLRMISGLS